MSSYFTKIRIEAQSATRELIAALATGPSSPLRSRLRKCGTSTEYKNSVACGAVACAKCRETYVRKQVAAVQAALAGANNDDLVMVSIVLELVGSVTEIGPSFASAKRKLRNIIEQNRRSRASWCDLQVVGWMEVDAFEPERFVDLLPHKKAQFEAMGVPYAGEGPVWVTTLHGIVSLAGVDRHALARELERGWSIATQVHAQPFDGARSVSDNINSVVRYSLKHRSVSNAHVTGPEPWTVVWRKAYYEYLNQWSRSFQSVRVWIRPRSYLANIDEFEQQEMSGNETVERYLEPMPMLF
ncbi:hypothetical protein [Brevundimonas sp.]|uniref:hypothetical protein n=1 Tax=Brevundimonas sp. TaxID=1871086 RepID=UPI002FCB3D14